MSRSCDIRKLRSFMVTRTCLARFRDPLSNSLRVFPAKGEGEVLFPAIGRAFFRETVILRAVTSAAIFRIDSSSSFFNFFPISFILFSSGSSDLLIRCFDALINIFFSLSSLLSTAIWSTRSMARSCCLMSPVTS